MSIIVVIIQFGALLAVFAIIIFPVAFGEIYKQTMEGGVDVSITYPEFVITGDRFPITILIENKGWEDKQDIQFSFESNSAITSSQEELLIDKIAEGGSYGATIHFRAISENESKHFLNLDYSQTLVQNNDTPLTPFHTNIAIPITIKDQPTIQIHTITPESIFTNAEFPFEVEVLSEDIDLYDLKIKIIPPRDIEFRGETLHTFSNVEKGETIKVRSEIITPKEEVNSQYNLPFEVVVSYEDHLGNEKSESETVPLILRPRIFMEVTTDGGIWIGNFFIAPYVSLGTIIGIPAGTIISILIKRAQKPKKRRKTK